MREVPNHQLEFPILLLQAFPIPMVQGHPIHHQGSNPKIQEYPTNSI
jgi:hypothetical protein